MDIINPLETPDNRYRELSDHDRLLLTLIQGAIYFVALVLAMIVCSFFSSCAASRTVEEHHHYEADTAAVRAQVDRRLTAWQTESETQLRQFLTKVYASWSSREDQRETVSELITETTDSLGRRIRQEQRTISRDVTRELQQQEQRLTQEVQARLRTVSDSLDSVYSLRIDSVKAHWEQADTTAVNIHSGPPGGKSLLQRFWDGTCWLLAAVGIAVIIVITSRWWPLIKD